MKTETIKSILKLILPLYFCISIFCTLNAQPFDIKKFETAHLPFQDKVTSNLTPNTKPELQNITQKTRKTNFDSKSTTSTIKVPFDFKTLQEAIDFAADGDTIEIAAGIYKETLIVDSKEINLRGESKKSTIIDALNSDELPALLINNSKIELSSLTIKNGIIGIEFINSTATVFSDITVDNNKLFGIFADNSTLSLTNNTIKNTQRFEGRSGLGIQIENSNVEVSEIIVEENSDTGLFAVNSTVQIDNSSFFNNNTWGVFLEDCTNVEVTNNVIENNGLFTGIGSGALLITTKDGLVDNNIFNNNNDAGLAVANSSAINISANNFSENEAFGTVIVSSERVTVSNNHIEKTILSDSFGFSGVFGSGIEIVESSASINNNTIIENELNGINISDPISIVEIVNNNVTGNMANGIFCNFSNNLTGCCNSVTNNAINNLSGCSDSIILCPCPTGSVDDQVSISPSSVLLTRLGAKTQLNAIIKSLNDTTLNITDESNWSAQNEAVATIDTNGLLTAINEGETEVCAEFQGITDCIKTTVSTIHSGINQWTTSPESELLGIIRDISIDPLDPKIIYAATIAGKVLKSVDRGETWSDKSEGIVDRGLFVLEINPNNRAIMFAGGSLSINRSIDGGETWNVIKKGVKVTSLVINPSDTNIVYAGTAGNGILKTVDNGDSWQRVNKGLRFKNVREDSFIINPKNPDTLYVAVETDESEGKGVYKTTDGGTNWREVNRGLVNEVQGLAIDHFNPETIYAGTLDKGVFKSVDGGQIWFELPNSTRNQNRTIAVDNLNSNVIYVGNQGQGVFMSRDAGKSWVRLNTQLTSRTIRAVEIDPVNPSIIYAGTLQGVSRFIHAFDNISASANPDGLTIDVNYEFNQNSVNNPTGFNIYRSTSIEGDYKKITNEVLKPDSSQFNDKDFLEGSTHVYRLTAVNEDGETLKGFTTSAKPLLKTNPDFNFEAAESAKNLTPGGSTLFPLNVESLDNFSEEIIFTASNIPQGATINFSPQSGTSPFAAKLNTIATDDILPGKYKMDLTASSDNKSHSVEVVLHVTPKDSVESSITLVVNASKINLDDSVEITGKVFPIRNEGSVTVSFVDPDGEVNNETVMFDKAGEFSIIKVMDKSGLWRINSSLPGDNNFAPTQSQTIELLVAQAETSIYIATNANQDTKQGDTLTLSGKVVPAPGNNNVLLEIDNIDGSLNFNSLVPLTDRGEFELKFNVSGGENGKMRIKARFDGNKDFNGSEKEIFVPIQEATGMAIIVAGGGNFDENEIWQATDNLCNYAYTIIKNQGIPDQILIDENGVGKNNRIFYLHPDSNNDADNDGIADTDAAPNSINLQKAIEEWAFNLMEADGSPTKTPLTIYLMGPGSRDLFQINRNESISSNDFDKWLDNLFNAIKNNTQDKSFNKLPINIIIESPQSGSFIDNLAVADGEIGGGRVIITSTDECDLTNGNCNSGEINIFGNGAISFSKQFFFGIKVGKSVGTAWAEANLLIRKLFDNQKPQLEGNGNSISNELEDEFTGSLIFINQNRLLKENKENNKLKNALDNNVQIINTQSFIIDQRPVVKGVQRNLVLNDSSSATLWAVVEDLDNNLNSVQALLFPPKSDKPESLELQFSEEEKRFEFDYHDFTLFGLYKILFFSLDTFNNVSLAETTLVNSQNIIPVILKGVIVNSLSSEPIEGAIVEIKGNNILVTTGIDGTYLLQLPAGVYNLIVSKEGFNEFNIKDLRVAVSDVPVTNNFELTPLSFTSSKASIHGIVTNSDGEPINRVKINLSVNETRHNAITNTEGIYKFADLNEGTYNMTARKTGYNLYEEKEIEVKPAESVELNILLDKNRVDR